MIKVQSGDHDSLGNSDLSHVTSVGEIIIALTHVKILPRLRDAEARPGSRRLGRCSTDSEVGLFQVCNILVKVKI